MMRRFAAVVLAAISLTFVPRTSAAPQTAKRPTFDQFLGAASPLEVVAAAKSEHVAWVAYEKGRRNVYAAAAPAFTPVKLTNFPDDDGVDLTEVQISADGSTEVEVARIVSVPAMLRSTSGPDG